MRVDFEALIPVLLSPGKAFTDPLAIALVLLAALLVKEWLRPPRRAAILAALLVAIALALVSTNAFRQLTARSLSTNEPPVKDPQVIVIATGGSRDAALSNASQQRMVNGFHCWREHPGSRLVIAGSDTLAGGLSDGTILLTREELLLRGVPSSSILLDHFSRTTREHPLGLLRLGFSPSTRVGVATSEVHMKRTLREFRRHFPASAPCRQIGLEHRQTSFNDFIPNSTALADSTALLHEWLGIAWYALSR